MKHSDSETVPCLLWCCLKTFREQRLVLVRNDAVAHPSVSPLHESFTWVTHVENTLWSNVVLLHAMCERAVKVQICPVVCVHAVSVLLLDAAGFLDLSLLVQEASHHSQNTHSDEDHRCHRAWRAAGGDVLEQYMQWGLCYNWSNFDALSWICAHTESFCITLQHSLYFLFCTWNATYHVCSCKQFFIIKHFIYLFIWTVSTFIQSYSMSWSAVCMEDLGDGWRNDHFIQSLDVLYFHSRASDYNIHWSTLMVTDLLISLWSHIIVVAINLWLCLPCQASLNCDLTNCQSDV